MLISVIIRTYNEEKNLNELLGRISTQVCEDCETEVVIVDSGSTDKTIEIAKKHSVKITYIEKNQFTFGKSLNIGCEFANGDVLVFISGHCIPVNNNWLECLVKPIIQGECEYTYGRQIGRDTTKFSEEQVFNKYFPNNSSIPQEGFFCNNANAAIAKDIWAKYQFNEILTGLEDMYLAKEIHDNNGKIGYVAESVVYHMHNESWSQVKTRYEREAIALQKIMPEVKVKLFDMFHFIFIGILKDMRLAFMDKVLLKELKSIFMFRVMQYYGSYKGNHRCRELSYKTKMRYFYPRANKY